MVANLPQKSELIIRASSLIEKTMLCVEPYYKSFVGIRIVPPHQNRVPKLGETQHAEMLIKLLVELLFDTRNHRWLQRAEKRQHLSTSIGPQKVYLSLRNQRQCRSDLSQFSVHYLVELNIDLLLQLRI